MLTNSQRQAASGWLKWSTRLLIVLSTFSPSFAASPCIACHRAEVIGFEKSAMAHSLTSSVQVPPGSFVHSASGTKFSVSSSDSIAAISLRRDGLSAKYPIAYLVGSGSHAFGEIVRIGEYLYQSPVSYYTGKNQWDMAPGYEADAKPDFTRPVTEECLVCHAGRPKLVPDTLNRYVPMQPFDEAISCERCHGDAAAHLAKASRQNIVNPARLPVRARDSVCEQCHLSGEVRILNPGSQFSDFRPGQNLEDVYSIYVRDHSGPTIHDASIKVISHVEQLALSVCARKSGDRMWCGTCHNPHEQPVNASSYFRDRCLGCHGQDLVKTHAKPVDNCIACHMPKRQAKDGAHTVFTDHRIARVPERGSATSTSTLPVSKLVAWHEPAGPLAMRNLGLANLEVGESQGSATLISEGAQQTVSAMKSFPPDAVILTKLGLTLLRSGAASDAIEPLEYAVRLEPNRGGSHVNLASAYKEAGLDDKAIAESERAIQLDSSLPTAYQVLVDVYLKKNDKEGVARLLKRFLEFMPNNMDARQSLRRYESEATK